MQAVPRLSHCICSPNGGLLFQASLTESLETGDENQDSVLIGCLFLGQH